MNDTDAVLDLHELDVLIEELAPGPLAAARTRRPGGGDARAELEREHERLLEALDRRWVQHYRRARLRYGRALVPVRERVCSGCHITLPTSAAPGAGEVLTVCESCGRILYWG